MRAMWRRFTDPEPRAPRAALLRDLRPGAAGPARRGRPARRRSSTNWVEPAAAVRDRTRGADPDVARADARLGGRGDPRAAPRLARDRRPRQRSTPRSSATSTLAAASTPDVVADVSLGRPDRTRRGAERARAAVEGALGLQRRVHRTRAATSSRSDPDDMASGVVVVAEVDGAVVGFSPSPVRPDRAGEVDDALRRAGAHRHRRRRTCCSRGCAPTPSAAGSPAAHRGRSERGRRSTSTTARCGSARRRRLDPRPHAPAWPAPRPRRALAGELELPHEQVGQAEERLAGGVGERAERGHERDHPPRRREVRGSR